MSPASCRGERWFLLFNDLWLLGIILMYIHPLALAPARVEVNNNHNAA